MKTRVVLFVLALWCCMARAANPISSPTGLYLIDAADVGSKVPTISAPPLDRTVTVGQSATFDTTAVGAGELTYQWTFNGVTVTSNRSFYIRPNCQLGDNGGHVRVIVNNGVGSIQSRTATLTVVPAGTAFYASPNGSNLNTGLTPDSPWTLQYALNHLGPGITVIVLPGQYVGAFKIYYISATASSPAVVRSQSKWKAVIANSPGRGFEVYQSQNVIIDGFCVTNCVSDGVKLLDPNNTVRNCWITHNGNVTDDSGITSNSTTTSANTFEYNLIEYNGILPLNGRTAGYGHGVYFSGSSNIVRGNVVRGNGGFGIHLYTGVSTVRQANNYIYGNLCYGHTNFYGVTLWNATTEGLLASTNYCFNNTFTDGMTVSWGTLCLSNNIIMPAVGNPNVPIYVAPTRPLNIRGDYNSGNIAISPAGPHDIIRNVAKTEFFVDPTKGLYWLALGSPARSKAALLSLPFDFFGNAGFVATDIGAFQFNPILALDVRTLGVTSKLPDYWSPLD